MLVYSLWQFIVKAFPIYVKNILTLKFCLSQCEILFIIVFLKIFISIF
nr:hypothetical protein BAR15_130025 [Bartonella sp. AR 15-3]